MIKKKKIRAVQSYLKEGKRKNITLKKKKKGDRPQGHAGEEKKRKSQSSCWKGGGTERPCKGSTLRLCQGKRKGRRNKEERETFQRGRRQQKKKKGTRRRKHLNWKGRLSWYDVGI